MKTEMLAPDVLLALGDAFSSNVTLFISGEDVLMVDALGSSADADALKQYVEQQLRKRIRLILCTHGFSDHMAALRSFPEAQVIAHERFEETFQAERFRSDEETGFFRSPELRVPERLLIKWGRYELEVFANPGHTASTLNVDVPALDLLLSADTAVGHMAYIAYGAPEVVDEALARAEARGRSRLIQGHGGVCDARVLGAARHYLRALEAQVRKAGGPSRPERVRAITLEDCLPPGLQGSDFESFFHRRNLDVVVERELWG